MSQGTSMTKCPGCQARDLTTAILVASEAKLRERVATLVDLVADIAYKNFLLERVAHKQIVERIWAEGALDRERRRHGKPWWA